MAPNKNKEKEPLERLRIWYGVSDLKQNRFLTGHWTINQEPPNWQQIEQILVRTTTPNGTGVKFNRLVNHKLLPRPEITIYYPSVYGENDRKNIELSAINGLEPASQEKSRMPISNRLRPSKGIFKRNRCTSGWSDIYDRSTNPVKHPLIWIQREPKSKPSAWLGVCFGTKL